MKMRLSGHGFCVCNETKTIVEVTTENSPEVKMIKGLSRIQVSKISL